jgi:hypothetical protein
MNTKSLLTRIGVPVLSLGLLGGIGATLATSASAAVKPVTVTANTHLNNHPDTTSGPGGGSLIDSTNGPVWAYDNATEKFTAIQQSNGSWVVDVDYVGSFHGFADPGANGTTDSSQGYGQPLDSNGSVKGTISFTVAAGYTPNPANLPGQSASNAHLTDNIKTLFGGNVPDSAIGGGDTYTFSYQNGNYVQNQPLAGPYTATGNVNGH